MIVQAAKMQRDRHRPREAEHGEQDEQRDRQRDQQLAVAEVALKIGSRSCWIGRGPVTYTRWAPGGRPSARSTASV